MGDSLVQCCPLQLYNRLHVKLSEIFDGREKIRPFSWTLSCSLSLLKVEYWVESSGTTFIFIQRPHDIWKKSSHGSTDVSMLSNTIDAGRNHKKDNTLESHLIVLCLTYLTCHSTVRSIPQFIQRFCASHIYHNTYSNWCSIPQFIYVSALQLNYTEISCSIEEYHSETG